MAQLVLENAPLEATGAKEITTAQLYAVAEAATVSSETIHNMPFEVTADDVYGALLTADKLGKSFT
ncbi:MAG: hypothetical protein RR582_11075 [Niameybacter sp.]|uniref:hypothetical protein n=1 Tax=Niameybacter sp. TaxID=2033640 RepID=UPI002FC8DFAA